MFTNDTIDTIINSLNITIEKTYTKGNIKYIDTYHEIEGYSTIAIATDDNTIAIMEVMQEEFIDRVFVSTRDNDFTVFNKFGHDIVTYVVELYYHEGSSDTMYKNSLEEAIKVINEANILK